VLDERTFTGSGYGKPTLAKRVPAGERWQYEIKHDGYRAQCYVREGVVQVFTKSGLDYADRLPAIVAGMAALPVGSAIVDGEAVMVGQDGVSDFFALHAALSAGARLPRSCSRSTPSSWTARISGCGRLSSAGRCWPRAWSGPGLA
jgi:ATP-dependent DNA ligase